MVRNIGNHSITRADTNVQFAAGARGYQKTLPEGFAINLSELIKNHSNELLTSPGQLIQKSQANQNPRTFNSAEKIPNSDIAIRFAKYIHLTSAA